MRLLCILDSISTSRSRFPKKRQYGKLLELSKPLKKKYFDCAGLCRLAITNHAADLENKIVSSNKIGNFYKYANKKLSCKTGVGLIKDPDGNILTDPVDRANCFNNFFASVFTTDNNIIPPVVTRVPDHVSLSSITFSRTDVFTKLKKLNAKSTGGPDHISPRLLKNIAPSIALPLASIFELFFQNSFLPQIWKQSYVKPIFKNNDSSSVTNYRPISLTCTCCKVMESVIHDQLMTYLHDHNLLSKAQHGFLTRKSTGTNLLSCLHDWQFSLKNKRSIDIIYIDFKKAFDSLVHSKIIAKLSAYGIGYELLSWIQAFLTGRTQRVIIDNALSSYIDVSSGVVQGSVLGPLIFLLFIEDIVDCLVSDDVDPTSCCIFQGRIQEFILGGGQTKVPNRKLRAKPESRARSARVSRAKPESRARSARELRAKPEPRAKPEKKRGRGLGRGLGEPLPRKFLKNQT